MTHLTFNLSQERARSAFDVSIRDELRLHHLPVTKIRVREALSSLEKAN